MYTHTILHNIKCTVNRIPAWFSIIYTDNCPMAQVVTPAESKPQSGKLFNLYHGCNILTNQIAVYNVGGQ